MGMVNDNEFEYKKAYTNEQRLEKYEKVIKHTGEERILVVLERHRKAKIQKQNDKLSQFQLFAINKNKTLVELMQYVKQNAGIDVSTSIFLYCNNQLLMMKSDITVGALYDTYQNKEDKHLYLKYADFETFG
ncbi:unnamed protein product (macronuclear) [Paramecium tetraurelia]|uniref:Autophagy-related protein n=1 Tax=Paramecium tetraurelia TaxID=5888 RepID=A0EGJ9_PARTE|nr:uncharacterized protein GSPATT00026764001 [Paramecium tetraurelia]CAK94440.1 unnamed protein product [Paramecium tetraurelia]|eukprot:XP_001461813.1 hypothetical protein (macronuclear) [Paramecium tetraurelia strain d4-2]